MFGKYTQIPEARHTVFLIRYLRLRTRLILPINSVYLPDLQRSDGPAPTLAPESLTPVTDGLVGIIRLERVRLR